MKLSLVNQRPYHTEALGEEERSVCTCCGRPAVEGEGALASSDFMIALYGYRWSEGHESRFTLGISPLGEDGDPPLGLAVVACRSDGEQLIYTVLDPDDSPWGSSESLGRVLSRVDLLERKVLPNLFELVDAIAANEPRLAARILASHEASGSLEHSPAG